MDVDVVEGVGKVDVDEVFGGVKFRRQIAMFVFNHDLLTMSTSLIRRCLNEMPWLKRLVAYSSEIAVSVTVAILYFQGFPKSLMELAGIAHSPHHKKMLMGVLLIAPLLYNRISTIVARKFSLEKSADVDTEVAILGSFGLSWLYSMYTKLKVDHSHLTNTSKSILSHTPSFKMDMAEKVLFVSSVLNLSVRFVRVWKQRVNMSRSTVQQLIQGPETVYPHKCVICFDDCVDMTVTPCGHVFCWKCILVATQSQRCCPVCRGSVDPSRLVPIRL
eukprot:m.127118 g.127118  ORF g.127118 m.127118 type:complete len:274 (-) comp12998_c2_seq7:1315-2136(-)